ncbi:MAG: multiheme c-type cytochrome [Candidatus Brocadiales bacterium]
MAWRIPFVVLSVALLGLLIIWIIREINPQWKGHQEAAYAQQVERLEQELERWSDPKWGDPVTAEKVRQRIEALKRPHLGVKQILLKGTGLWKEGENGEKVDRCMTCHIDEDKLVELHPKTFDYFPYDIYGCTVCHGGHGESLRLEKAHKGMHTDRKEMIGTIDTADAVLELWKELAKLSPKEDQRASDYKYYSITGEKAVYVGSITCLRCHKGLTTWHINRWKDNKFVTMERVKKARDFIEGDEDYRKKCYKCHTTGYDEESGKYVEEGVTCEACHGPGQLYVYFMSMGKVEEAQRLSKLGFSYEVCGRCHMARHHEMRAQFLAKIQSEGPKSQVLAQEVEKKEALQKETSQEEVIPVSLQVPVFEVSPEISPFSEDNTIREIKLVIPEVGAAPPAQKAEEQEAVSLDIDNRSTHSGKEGLPLKTQTEALQEAATTPRGEDP